MPPRVKRPIRQAARETANYLEPQLVDAIAVVERLVKAEKDEITEGLDTRDDYRLMDKTQHYVHAKHATQTLKAIAAEGLRSDRADTRDLVNLLNMNTSAWHMDSYERNTMEPLREFVDMYGKELAAEALRKAAQELAPEAALQAQQRVKNDIKDYEYRYGADRPRDS